MYLVTFQQRGHTSLQSGLRPCGVTGTSESLLVSGGLSSLCRALTDTQTLPSYLTCAQLGLPCGAPQGGLVLEGGLQGTFQHTEDPVKSPTGVPTSPLGEIKQQNGWCAHWTLGCSPLILRQLHKSVTATTEHPDPTQDQDQDQAAPQRLIQNTTKVRDSPPSPAGVADPTRTNTTHNNNTVFPNFQGVSLGEQTRTQRRTGGLTDSVLLLLGGDPTGHGGAERGTGFNT